VAIFCDVLLNPLCKVTMHCDHVNGLAKGLSKVCQYQVGPRPGSLFLPGQADRCQPCMCTRLCASPTVLGQSGAVASSTRMHHPGRPLLLQGKKGQLSVKTSDFWFQFSSFKRSNSVSKPPASESLHLAPTVGAASQYRRRHQSGRHLGRSPHCKMYFYY
jgi:hypothetical protein